MFFSLFRQREVTKRDHVARFDAEGISTLRTELRDSLRSNRSSLHLKVPFSVVAFLNCISRYRNINKEIYEYEKANYCLVDDMLPYINDSTKDLVIAATERFCNES